MNNPGTLDYFFTITLIIIGLYFIIAHRHLVKKIVGISIIQVAVLLFCIATLNLQELTKPLVEDIDMYGNTAVYLIAAIIIAWGLVTAGWGYYLVSLIRQIHGTTDEHEILDKG